MPTFYRDWKVIARRAIYEAALPLLGGAAWVAWAWYKESSFFEALSGFGIGYLFVLAAQGQLLRIAKNVRDEGNAKEFRTSFLTIQQILQELRAHNLAAIGSINGVEAIEDELKISRSESDPFRTESLLYQSEYCIKNSLYHAAVLTAITAFNVALESTFGWYPSFHTTSLEGKLEYIEKRSDLPNFREKIGALIRARDDFIKWLGNTLANDFTKREAFELVEAFSSGVDYLKKAYNVRPETESEDEWAPNNID